MSADKKTFRDRVWDRIKKIIPASLYIITSIYLGAINAIWGIKILKDYYLPFWITAFLIIGVSILILSVIGQAIKPVWPKPTHAPVATAMVLMTITVLLVLGVTSFMRGDNFDLETGAAQKWITLSTGRIWHEIPGGFKGITILDKDGNETDSKTFHDPTTGELVKPLGKELYELLQRQKNEKSTKQIKASDFREFKIGEVFEMQGMRAGDSNGFYVRQPMGKRSYRFVTSYMTGVKAVFRDGREFDLKPNYPMPNGDYDFKVVAYEDGARVSIWFENP